MESANNNEFLEQLYKNRTISSVNLSEYAVKLGISCQKLKQIIVSEQYNNSLIISNIFNKFVKYRLFSCYEVNQFYKIITTKEEFEFLCSSINYEHPNLKIDAIKFISYLDGIDKEQLDKFELYTSEIFDNVNFYEEDTINTIIELAHKTGISTKKLSDMLNENYEEIFNIIKKLTKSNIGNNNYANELMNVLNNTGDLLYKISSLNYNYPSFCQNRFRLINAILTCNTSDLVKIDDPKTGDEILNSFVLTKIKKDN